MQISSLSIVPVRQPQNRGPGVDDREQNQVINEPAVSAFKGVDEAGGIDRLADAEGQLVPPVETSRRTFEVFSRDESEDSNLPFASRKALQIFLQNTPNIPQQLGVELVGIDTFV